MFQILKRNPLAAAIAIFMHLIIILLMIFGLDWLEQPKPTRFKVDVVKARVVDAAKVDAEVKRLRQAEKSKREKADAARSKEIKQLEELRKKRKKEEQRIADLKDKRKAQEKAEVKRKAEAKRQSDAKKSKVAKEKKRKAAEAEKRKAAEAKKRKAVEEKKRKAAEAKKRKAEKAKKRKLAERRQAEAEMRAAMEAERDAAELGHYEALIQQTVTASWLRPIGVGDGLKCTLRIRMAAGGNVLAAEIVESSGSGSFDRSARAAVLKADPLPVPTGRMFERFRDINFVFAPSGSN